LLPEIIVLTAEENMIAKLYQVRCTHELTADMFKRVESLSNEQVDGRERRRIKSVKIAPLQAFDG
jgi:hypothetical protein